MNILAIDDDISTLDTLKSILDFEGVKVFAFESMPQNILFTPDLIVLDLYMPGKSGIEICREIKKNNKLKNVPVVMLSSSQDIKDKIKSLQAGAIEYIEKPIIKDTLLKSITKYIHIGKIFNSMSLIIGNK